MGLTETILHTTIAGSLTYFIIPYIWKLPGALYIQTLGGYIEPETSRRAQTVLYAASVFAGHYTYEQSKKPITQK
jgi:hypothetical protein